MSDKSLVNSQARSSKLLTVKEAAEYAGVSVSLIYSWCEQRRLAHLRLGGRGKRGKIVIRPADLDSFLEEQRIESR